jgi:hypothetical protein
MPHFTHTNNHTSRKTISQTTGIKQGARDEREHDESRVGNDPRLFEVVCF